MCLFFSRRALVAIAAVSAFCAHGQAPGVPGKPSTDFAAEPFVVERLSRVIAMNADGTGLRTQTSVIKLQSEAALRQFSVVTVPFASASEQVEFTYVRAHHADGSVTDSPVTQPLEQPEPVTREAPFYSDLKSMQLPVKNLRVGDRLEWQARVRKTKAESAGQFWGEQTFISEGVALEDVLELSVPAGKSVQVWTNPRIGGQPTQTTEGDRRVYRWASSNLKPTVGAIADAEKERKEKTLLTAEEELDVSQGKVPDVAWSTFASWEAVGAWYRGLEDDRMQPDAAIKAKVAELTAGKTTQEEKVRAVYGYVSAQIRYIGVALGIGRYQPHAAGAVLDNQYGDCKDKHTLLAAMLTALGLQPDAVLIGAGVRFNQALPSPGSFNHLITRVQVDGKEVWLDSTAEVAPYGVLFPILRDRQALAVPQTGPAAVVRTPAGLPYEAFSKSTSVGTLDKSLTSDSTLTFTIRDDDELVLRSVLRQVSAAQYGEFVQKLMAGMGFGGTTSEPVIGPVDDTSQPMTLSFHYRRVKDADWGTNRITMMFVPITLPVVDEKKPPVSALLLGIPRVETSTVELKLPEGWRAELPEAIHAHTAFATCDVTYRFADGTLYGERKLTILKDKVSAADWKPYKTWYDGAGASGVPYVQLVPPRGGAPATRGKVEEAPVATSNASAMELLAKVPQAFQENNLDEAKSLLDGAKALNSTQQGLWASYGFLSFRKGDADTAIEDYRKEISLHPGSYATYPALVTTLMLSDRREEAISALRSWAADDAENPQAVIMLIRFLMEDNQPAEAAKAAESGLAHLPEEARTNPQLTLAVGQAELKGGDSHKGAAMLKQLIDSTDDNTIKNDAAYELADAKLELPLAESTEHAVLDKLTEQTRGWTLDESLQTLRGTTGLLTASWDTMGWILFREGKAEEAEGYLRAAWLNTEQTVVGQHLGDLQAARGDHRAALADYELALATVHDVDGRGVRRKTPSPQTVELQNRIRDEKKRGTPSTVGDAHMAVQTLRQLKLGPAAGRSGTAEYRLLIAHGKVVRSELTNPDAKLLAGAGDLIAHADLTDFFPKGSDAQLVHTATLNCHQQVCELVVGP